MPKGGATSLRDSTKDALVVRCDKCGRSGQYSVARLFAKHGDIGLPDLLAVLTGDCPRRLEKQFGDMCTARMTSAGRTNQAIDAGRNASPVR